MRPTPVIPAVLLAALAVAAVAASAQAATVSPAGVRFPQVAVNADGATVVAWERKTKGGFAVEVRTGDAPLELDRTRRLAARGYAPRVAIGADGTRAVQWMQYAGDRIRMIRVAVARPGHGFGKGQVVYRRRANTSPAGVVVQPTGRVVALWEPKPGRLAVALAARGHAFGHSRSLGITGSTADTAIALDPRDGAAVLATATPASATPPTNPQAAVRTLAMTSRAFSAPVILSDPAGLAEAHPVVVSGSGGTGVAYTQTTSGTTLSLFRRNADGSWGARELIASPVFGENVFAVGLLATLPADGSALATWTIDTETGGLGGSISEQTVGSVAAPGAPFGVAQAISPAVALFGATAVAAAGDEAFIATAQAHGPVLLATKLAGARALGVPIALTGDGDGDILLAAGGSHVLAAWQQHDRLRMVAVR
jgi:hypothetical protein